MEKKIEEKIPNIFHFVLVKKIFSLSTILKKTALNINTIVSESIEVFGVFKPIEKKFDETEVKDFITSENESIYNLLSKKNNNYNEEFEEDLEKHLKLLKDLKKYQKEDSLGYKITYGPLLKIFNFNCKMKEIVLFSLFALNRDDCPRLNVKLINKIQKIYLGNEKKNESHQDHNQAQVLPGDERFLFNKATSGHFISPFINQNCQKNLYHQVKQAWLFRNKDIKLEKQIQYLLKDHPKRNKFEEPILQIECLSLDKYDYLQIFDFNFKYVFELFNYQNWYRSEYNDNFKENHYRNKKKIITYLNNLAFRLGKYTDFIEKMSEQNRFKYEKGILYLKVKKNDDMYILIYLFIRITQKNLLFNVYF